LVKSLGNITGLANRRLAPILSAFDGEFLALAYTHLLIAVDLPCKRRCS